MFDEFIPRPSQDVSTKAATAPGTVAKSSKMMLQEPAQADLAMRREDLAEQRARQLQARLENEIVRATVLAERLRSREDLLGEIYRSHSWRVTAPLRALTNLFRQHGGRRDAMHISDAPTLNTGPEQPTIFIECTHTFHTELNTGIQRVVRNVVRHAEAVAAEHGYAVIPVMLEEGRFVAADIDVVLSNKLRMPAHVAAPMPTAPTAEPEPVPLSRKIRTIRTILHPVWRGFLRAAATLLPFAPVRRFLYAPADQIGLAHCIIAVWYGIRLQRMPMVSASARPFTLDQRPSCTADILLLLDSSWPFPIWPAVERFKRRGGRVAGVVFDIIPISHSYTCVPELIQAFKTWLDGHARNTDAFIAISQSIARQLKDYLHSELCGRDIMTNAPISYFYLGSELDFAVDIKDIRPAIEAIFESREHVILMVGSIEPRKNHAFVLDAFERLWKTGERVSLVIIGRHGWKTEGFFNRVARHQQLGQQLFFLRDANDSELDFAYRNASALVIASEVEGFGLPVVEAFQRGLPVLCSDIPVFREIADGRATFFGLDNPDRLTTALMNYCQAHDPAARRERTPQSWLSWRESTEQLFANLLTALDGNVNIIASPAARPHSPILSGWPDGADGEAQLAYTPR